MRRCQNWRWSNMPCPVLHVFIPVFLTTWTRQKKTVCRIRSLHASSVYCCINFSLIYIHMHRLWNCRLWGLCETFFAKLVSWVNTIMLGVTRIDCSCCDTKPILHGINFTKMLVIRDAHTFVSSAPVGHRLGHDMLQLDLYLIIPHKYAQTTTYLLIHLAHSNQRSCWVRT